MGRFNYQLAKVTDSVIGDDRISLRAETAPSSDQSLDTFLLQGKHQIRSTVTFSSNSAQFEMKRGKKTIFSLLHPQCE